MNKRRWFVLSLMVLVAGATALAFSWRPRQPPGSFVTIDELGYQIEFEIDPATHYSYGSNPTNANFGGKEYVGASVQGHYSVMILDGDLTVSHSPRGEVKKGDRIKVTLDKRVWVNDVERRP